MLLCFFLGVVITGIASRKEIKKILNIMPQYNNKLEAVIDYVETKYADKISRKELEELAIPLFLEALDPHSAYIPSLKTQAIEDELEGNFEGIGVQFYIYDDTVYVVKVISDGPSEKAGLLAGDRIINVNDITIAGIGITNDSVMKKLKGKSGSIVNLDIKRKGHDQFLKIPIKRGSIPISSIDAFYLIDKETGYIKISNFSRTTHDEFLKDVLKMKKSGIKSLIVDLRGNSGGYMFSVIDIVDEFLEEGKAIVYTEGNASKRVDYIATSKKTNFIDLNIAILIDELSASASEIFAGAIQDNDRGIIIGRRSFGKGLVQEAVKFTDGSVLRLTVSRYYTPSGRCIQRPYNNGTKEYYSDQYLRYAYGDTANYYSDTAKIYFTSKGRKVYAGGGITPDITIPLDTSGYSKLYSDINRKNVAYLFAIKFVDNNRQALKTITTINTLEKYIQKNNVYEQFWDYAQNNGIEINNNDLIISKNHIENLILAYIARQTLDENAFFRIFNRNDNYLKDIIFY